MYALFTVSVPSTGHVRVGCSPINILFDACPNMLRTLNRLQNIIPELKHIKKLESTLRYFNFSRRRM